ncbi:MAG: CHAT domain-containing protein [Bryobacteraceae bacterium]
MRARTAGYAGKNRGGVYRTVIRNLAAFLAAAALLCGQEGPNDDAIRKLIQDGRFAEAEPLARSALADAEARSGPHSKAVAAELSFLLELAVSSSRIKDPQDQAQTDRALALTEELYGPTSLEMARTLRLAGEMAWHNQDNAPAREFYQRALHIHETLPESGDTLFEHAEAWNDMAVWLATAFDYPGAKVDYERALPLYEKALGHESRAVARCLTNLAVTLNWLGDQAGAKARYQEALRIYEKTVGPNHFRVAVCLNNLAFLLMKTGQPAEAAELLRRALGIYEATFGETHQRTAVPLSNLADALTASGKYDSAVPYYERAGRIYGTLFGPLSPDVAANKSQRAVNLALAGKTSQAAELAAAAEEISRAYFLIAIRTMPEREALLHESAKASGRATSGLNTLLSLAAAGAPGGPALNALIRWRALVFDEIAARHRAAESGDPEVTRLAAGLASASEELAHLVVGGPKSMTASQYQTALDRAREAKYQAERLLAEKSLPFRREFDSRQIGLSEVAAAIPEDAALISFVRYPRTPFRIGAPAENPAAQFVFDYLALVLRSGQSQPAVVDLGNAAAVDALVAEVRRRIAEEARDPGRSPRQSEDSYRRTATRLRLTIWDPLEPYWRGAKRLFIVPDGALHTVNFAALPVGPGYQVESGPLIHYLLAERDIAAATPPVTGSGMLMVANPAFDGRPALTSNVGRLRGEMAACGAYRNLHFDSLPGTAREAWSVSDIWRESGGAESSLVGARALKSSFLEQAAGKRVLHLATHGFFLDACAQATGPTVPRSGAAVDNPLLLSGLALVGANESKRPDEGILTAEEIVSLNLDGLDWAVLSACDTGLGAIQAGEGVFGLRRAFQLAGARTVIMSLWQVDDTSTRLWMENLYRTRFLRGAATSEAVRSATLAVLAHRRAEHLSTHPLYWAGFLAVGEWR